MLTTQLQGTKVSFFSQEERKSERKTLSLLEDEEDELPDIEEEVEYYVEIEDVKDCLRNISRPDGLSISGKVSSVQYINN